MTFTSKRSAPPKSLRVTRAAAAAEGPLNLIIHGQGVVLFHAPSPCSLSFSDASGTEGLKVSFTETNVLVNLVPSNEPLLDTHNSKGIVPQQGACYWFSLDSQNQQLYAGVGEARIENMTYTYKFPAEDRIARKAFLENLVSVQPVGATVERLLRDPITRNIPMKVKDTDELTMDSIASATYMPKANLSLTSQKLYNCIAGKEFVLDSPDFPEFTRAIEASIATPGKWCYERLKEKASEFDKDKPNVKETYLRITLGENNGESPGIPYVMEIWPVGHFSPVHDHGGSSAIIRVLHGSVQVSLFPFLSSDDILPFAKAEFSKGDITWISPTLNQVHQLKNLDGGKDTCITIQCYMYEDSDTTHYDYFNYIDGARAVQQFDPDSDMDFLAFKEVMKREWAEQAKPCWWKRLTCRG